MDGGARHTQHTALYLCTAPDWCSDLYPDSWSQTCVHLHQLLPVAVAFSVFTNPHLVCLACSDPGKCVDRLRKNHQQQQQHCWSLPSHAEKVPGLVVRYCLALCLLLFVVVSATVCIGTEEEYCWAYFVGFCEQRETTAQQNPFTDPFISFNFISPNPAEHQAQFLVDSASD